MSGCQATARARDMHLVFVPFYMLTRAGGRCCVRAYALLADVSLSFFFWNRALRQDWPKTTQCIPTALPIRFFCLSNPTSALV